MYVLSICSTYSYHSLYPLLLSYTIALLAVIPLHWTQPTVILIPQPTFGQLLRHVECDCARSTRLELKFHGTRDVSSGSEESTRFYPPPANHWIRLFEHKNEYSSPAHPFNVSISMDQSQKEQPRNSRRRRRWSRMKRSEGFADNQSCWVVQDECIAAALILHWCTTAGDNSYHPVTFIRSIRAEQRRYKTFFLLSFQCFVVSFRTIIVCAQTASVQRRRVL